MFENYFFLVIFLKAICFYYFPMTSRMISGIENEFYLLGPNGSNVNCWDYFDRLLGRINTPYFKYGLGVWLNSGGKFYIDGHVPEITSAPFYLKPGAVTELTNNLFQNANVLVDAIEEEYTLLGYSAHYNFTIPNINSNKKFTFDLAKTLNPVIQFFVETSQSLGVMFRYREHNRIEVCGDYFPDPKDVEVALAFQTLAFNYLSKNQSNDLIEINEGQVCKIQTKTGYICKIPQVIKEGRRAILKTNHGNMSLQDLLGYYMDLFRPLADEVLSKEEIILLEDVVNGFRGMPIEKAGLPRGYEDVQHQEVDSKNTCYLAQSFMNSIEERSFNGINIKPVNMCWNYLILECSNNRKIRLYNAHDRTVFEKLCQTGRIGELLEADCSDYDLFSRLGFSNLRGLIIESPKNINENISLLSEALLNGNQRVLEHYRFDRNNLNCSILRENGILNIRNL